MLLLSIDSSNGYSNVLLTDENFNKVSESVSDFHEKHSVFVFKQLDEIMRKADMGLSDLTGIAVILGPGSYTGIRVSLTIAKTLSYVLGINITGVESLLVCAYSLAKDNTGSKYIIAVKDAAKGNYYVSEYFADEANFTRQTKIDIFNISELKSFVENMKNKPSIVYGFNKEDDYEKFKNEFEGINLPAPFDLKQTAYFASAYVTENGNESGISPFSQIKYAEELSPYYVYGNGPF
jgi:tRNA threonylcarbamoyladenosine biosynthesis protein TsaB